MKKSYLLSILLVVGLLVNGCKKIPAPPPAPAVVEVDTLFQIANSTASSLSLTSAIRSAGNQKTISVGHVCSTTNTLPTLSNYDAYSSAMVFVNELPFRFTAVITGLQPTTRYYIRAYCRTETGVVYGPTFSARTQLRFASAYDQLAQLLTDSLQPKDIGFAFSIYQGDKLMAQGAGGLQSRATEPEGALPFTPQTKLHIASLSKPITAIAFVRAAADHGVNLTDRIAAYLPPTWPKGPNVDQLTFEDLLTHRSGLTTTGGCQIGPLSENAYSSLKEVIARGTTQRGQFCYQNINFALFRLLLPAIVGYQYVGDDGQDALATSVGYQQAVHRLVFEPLGIEQAAVSPPTPPAYLYGYPYRGGKGYNPGSLAGREGAIGWYLSVAEAAKLYATVLASADQVVLTNAQKRLLLSQRLGCFDALLTDQGVLYYHDGLLWNDNPAQLGTYVGSRSVWLLYPEAVTIVVHVNAINQQRLFPSGNGQDIVTYVDGLYHRAQQLQKGRQAASGLLYQALEVH